MGADDMNDHSMITAALRRAATEDEQVSGTVVSADLRGIYVDLGGVMGVIPRTECAHGLLRTAQAGAAWRGYVVEVSDRGLVCSIFPRSSRAARSKRRGRFLGKVSLGSVVTGKVIGREPFMPDSPALLLVLLHNELVWGAVPARPEEPALTEGVHARFRIVEFADVHDRNLDVFVWPISPEWRP